jgi:hypothetical protein
MTIMSTDFPSPETVMPDVEDFLRIAGEGLDAGTAEAREHYERRRREIEPELASMITRSVAKERLSEHGLLTEEVQMIDVPLIGLRVVVPRPTRLYRVAIWKSPDDRIPAPGQSHRKRLFLERNQLALAIPWDRPEIHLALVWNASAAFYLTDLFLHMPSGTGESFFRSPESYWSRKIPLPVELEKPVAWAEEQPEALPYEKDEKEEGKAEDRP